MHFLAFSGRVKGQGIDTGSEKEATDSYLARPVLVCGGLHARKETASFCAFPQRLLQEFSSKSNLASKTLRYAVLKHCVPLACWSSPRLSCSFCGHSSQRATIGTEFIKYTGIQTFSKIDFCLNRRKSAIDSVTDKVNHRGLY